MEIISTKKVSPPRIIIFGDGGTGKSSTAAAFDRPVFINIEDGLDEIETSALPRPNNYDEVIEQLTFIYSGKHDFKTLVVDSLDHLENMINDHVLKSNDVESISDIGFGGGYQKAFECFQRIMKAMSAIREKNGMAIIFICHGHVRTFNNVSGADYDRWEMKLRDKNAALFFEFCTAVGFIHLNIAVKTEKKGFREKSKAVGGSQRVISFQPSAGHQSKNRYGIEHDIILNTPEDGAKAIMAAIVSGQQ